MGVILYIYNHWPVWLNGWVFVHKLSGCGFESSCSVEDISTWSNMRAFSC